MKNDNPTINTASASYVDPTTGQTKETPRDVVKQHPTKVVPPVVQYTKTVRNLTTRNPGEFVEADTLSGGVLVNTGDVIEYQITIKKLTGTVMNTILTDVLPTNGGFVMSGYSINNGTMVSATSFPATNITALLNSGDVVVTLYGHVGNPTATQFVNTALVTENGAPVATYTPGSNVAWTYLQTPKSNPKLHLSKYWINPKNPTQTGDHYTVEQNTAIKFILRVENVGNVAAQGVINDPCPANLLCQSYRILPSTTTVAYTPVIPVGTVPVGGFVEVEVSAIAYPSMTSDKIHNVATLYRVCTPEEDASDGTVDGLCKENTDDATLNPAQPNQCGDGIKQRHEQCDLGKNFMPGTIGYYLDTTTVYPSGPNRGAICTAECRIQQTQLNYCGDGKLGKLEQCDLGPNSGTIGDYLDHDRTMPSGAYKGATCSSSCVIEHETLQPKIPACWYGDSIISVMKDEIFPFSWDIEIKNDETVNSCNDANAEGKIVRSSLICTFKIYNKNEEMNKQSSSTIQLPCNTQQWEGYKLFEAFRSGRDGQTDAQFVNNPFGTFYIDSKEFSVIVSGEL